MTKFYDLFPKIPYDMARNGQRNRDIVVDIFTRIGVVSEVKNNALSYYEYLVRDQDTPENLADRLYGDSEYHWIILLMNDMVNPLFDWPKNIENFNNYIISKYGSISNAQLQIHHYEKVIKRTDMNTDTYNEIHMEIDETAYNDLPDTSLENETLSSGRTIEVLITRQAISCYDFENEENERKRSIKLLKREHIAQLINELNGVLEKSGATSTTTRRIVR